MPLAAACRFVALGMAPYRTLERTRHQDFCDKYRTSVPSARLRSRSSVNVALWAGYEGAGQPPRSTHARVQFPTGFQVAFHITIAGCCIDHQHLDFAAVAGAKRRT